MDDEFDNETFTHFDFEVRLVRVIDNFVIPSKLSVKLEFIPMETENEYDIDLVFTKIKYWLDNIVNKSVAFCHENSVAIEMFIDSEAGDTRIGNILFLTPDEPTDQHLAVLFQAKLQALAGDILAFGPVEVKSDSQLGLTFTFIGNAKEVLPDAKTWMGERSYFDLPWWHRDDASSIDVLPPDDADLSVKPAWAFNFDFLEKSKQNSKTTGVIVRPQFRPTVIDGGKKT